MPGSFVFPTDGNDQPVMVFPTTGPVHRRTFAASSVQTPAVGANTRVVRVMATSACLVLAGVNPTAQVPADGATDTDGGIPLAANVPEFIKVQPGDKIAVIQISAGGDLFVSEVMVDA